MSIAARSGKFSTSMPSFRLSTIASIALPSSMSFSFVSFLSSAHSRGVCARSCTFTVAFDEAWAAGCYLRQERQTLVDFSFAGVISGAAEPFFAFEVIRAPRPVVCAFEDVTRANSSPLLASPLSVRLCCGFGSLALAINAANALETPSRCLDPRGPSDKLM